MTTARTSTGIDKLDEMLGGGLLGAIGGAGFSGFCFGIVFGVVGAAMACYEAALGYAKGREQFGRPIGTNQAIQWPIADAAIEIHAARLMVYDAASRADRGERFTERRLQT